MGKRISLSLDRLKYKLVKKYARIYHCKIQDVIRNLITQHNLETIGAENNGIWNWDEIEQMFRPEVVRKLRALINDE